MNSFCVIWMRYRLIPVPETNKFTTLVRWDKFAFNVFCRYASLLSRNVEDHACLPRYAHVLIDYMHLEMHKIITATPATKANYVAEELQIVVGKQKQPVGGVQPPALSQSAATAEDIVGSDGSLSMEPMTKSKKKRVQQQQKKAQLQAQVARLPSTDQLPMQTLPIAQTQSQPVRVCPQTFTGPGQVLAGAPVVYQGTQPASTPPGLMPFTPKQLLWLQQLGVIGQMQSVPFRERGAGRSGSHSPPSSLLMPGYHPKCGGRGGA